MKDGRLVEGRIVSKSEAPSGIIALRGKKISKADLLLGKRPSSAISDSSTMTVDAKPALIGPSPSAHGMGLFDVDPSTGKPTFTRVRPGPAAKPVIVFAPDAEKPQKILYSDNHVSKKAQLIDKKQKPKSFQKKRQNETSSEGSGSYSGESPYQSSDADDVPNFEDIDAK